MKTLEKENLGRETPFGKIFIDNSLNDRPISKAELRKLEEAREYLKKHPIPEHILRKIKG